MLPFHSVVTGRSLSRCCAALAILVAGVCTTAMNWRFSYQLGTSVWDSHIWAVFSVALDVAKWLMLPLAALAWRAHKLRAVAAVLIWLVATVYSFAAAIGFAALNRDTVAAERQSQAQLRSTLEIMRQSPRWQSSAACADATAKRSRDFCITYRATEARITSTVIQGNPQTALIAGLTGLSAEAVNLLLAIFLAVACEVISALGLFAILVPEASPPRARPSVPAWKPPKWQGTPIKPTTGSGQPAHAGRRAQPPVITSRAAKWKSPR